MVQKKVSLVRPKKMSAAQSLRPLQRFALFFFSRPRLTAFLALIIAGFGVLSYSTLLKREGETIRRENGPDQ